MFNRGPVGHLQYRIHQVMMKHNQFIRNEFRYNILIQYNEFLYKHLIFTFSSPEEYFQYIILYRAYKQIYSPIHNGCNYQQGHILTFLSKYDIKEGKILVLLLIDELFSGRLHKTEE